MVEIRDIEYAVDGRTMVGRLALPDGSGQRPAVLICHEGSGLDPLQRDRAERVATELGYVAFALDYHGGGVPLPDRDQMMARLGEVMGNAERTRALGQAGLDVLLAEPRVDTARVAAIGYCFGGTMVFELARTGAELKAVVGFHPGLVSPRPDDSRHIVGSVLACIGADDPLISAESIRAFEQEMAAADVDWQVHLYGGVQHSFTHPQADLAGIPGIKYDERADRRSWAAMLTLFEQVL